MKDHIPRTLTYATASQELATILDDEILGLDRAAIVLGEPGIGKSELLEYLARQPSAVLRSASAFVEHPAPKSLVSRGKVLLIDGLDELAALREGDPINRVLRQLVVAGTPRFVLSCRAADWRSAVARHEISVEYGEVPYELQLSPFTQADAVSFLSSMLAGGRAAAQQVVETLEQRGGGELWSNPLTLKLIGEIAEQPATAFKSRADLFARASSIMWNERNDRQERSLLNQLDETSALDAAGAICAMLILAGAESVTSVPSTKHLRGVIDVAEIARLPGAAAASTILSSRLFALASERGAMKPIHRTVAEYLGARWLARNSSDGLAQSRLMATLTVDGGPPASLRGLHAWLAHFSSGLARIVIENDPYGVVRYGDADELTPEKGRWLLAALERRQRENPYFRAEDWGRHVAKGLAQNELAHELRRLIKSPDTTFHLRSLLLEGIRGGEVVEALAPDLRGIMLSEEEGRYSYRERRDAALSLVGLSENDLDWPKIIGGLTESVLEDSTRLAIELMDEMGYEKFEPRLIATAVIAQLGIGLAPELQERRSSFSIVYMVSRRLGVGQIEPVLDALVQLLPALPADADYEVRSELTMFVVHLIVRLVEVLDPAPAKILAWLRLTPNRTSYARDDEEALSKYLRERHDVRRAIQRILMFEERADGDPWRRIVRGREIQFSLALSSDDIAFFLTELARKRPRLASDVALWRELTNFVRRIDGGADQIIAAAAPFASGDGELEAHLHALSVPAPRPEWELREERRQLEAAAKKAASYRQHREEFGKNIDALARGELRWILPVSRSYFALFADTDRTLAPAERIKEWLGPELLQPALAGLHAVLGRDDLPTLEQIVRSYAESKRWNFIHPMLASLSERISRGEAVERLGKDRLIGLRIALHHEYMGDRADLSKISSTLEIHLRDFGAMEEYARLLVEPFLERNSEHITGLHGLLNSVEERALMQRLAHDWLVAFNSMPRAVEAELVDYLCGEGLFSILAPLARERLGEDIDSDERRYAWLTTLFLSDFESGVSAIGNVEEVHRDLFWHFRHRLGRSRRGDESPVPVSPDQLEWVVRNFRGVVPVVQMPVGSSTGDTNDWDATQAMRHFIERLARDPSNDAARLLQGLAAAPRDQWSDFLLSASDEQRSARREAAFLTLSPDRLRSVLSAGAPGTMEDLQVIVLWALQALQGKLTGSDTDLVQKYHEPSGRPHNEDYCTDRLIEDLEPLLAPFGIGRIPQRDMPAGKRADIVFTVGDLELPVECKGQWNTQLWTGATDQLDALYLRNWRAADRGVYLVYWFGADVVSERAPRPYPLVNGRPQSAGELKVALVQALPQERRASIAIEVLDFTR